MAKTLDNSWMHTSEAAVISDARPKYHSWQMQPLGPMRPLTQDAADPEERRGGTHIHLHLGKGGDDDEPGDEMEGEVEPSEEEFEGEPEEEPQESVAELCEQLEGIADRLRSLSGNGETRRRQHTRDSRSVPSPSEISNLSQTKELSPAERRRVVADGAELLRQRAIGERAYLGDLSDALNDYWDRKLEEDKRKRR
jgi:hypothetical protein